MGTKDYYSIHNWLRKYFGKADVCENPSCKRKSTIYQWALLKDKEHDYKRENYWKLCLPCHKKYDIDIKRGQTKGKIIRGTKILTRFSLYIPPKLLEDLHEAAKKNYRSVNGEIIQIMENHLAQQEQQKPLNSP
jgi:hypothetical protein